MNKNYIILNNKVNQKDKNGNYINLELDRQATREYFLNNVNQNTVFFHSLEEKLDYLVENRYYDKKVLDKYTMEEIKDVFKLAYSKKFRFRSYLGAFMFYDRYALRTTDKERILERYEDRLSMIALTVGRNVDEAKEFLNILINRQLQPATPIYMNSGKLRAGSLVSCYVLNTEDNLESISYVNHSAMKLSQMGAGIGLDMTNIRARGDSIKGIENMAGGILPPSKVLEDIFSYINQLGTRNGSGVVSLNIFHNDIEEFINSKKVNADEKLRLKTLSTAILIPDKFMEILKDNTTKYYYTFYPKNVYDVTGVELAYMDMNEWYDKLVENKDIRKTQRNKLQILQEILKCQSEAGYPYTTFIDNVNNDNNLKGIGKIRALNLCVAPYTKILTKEYGYVEISSVENQLVNVWNGEQWSETVVRKTGENQKLLRVITDNYQSIDVTEYHKFYIQEGYSRDGKIIEKRTNELNIGDKLIKFDLPSNYNNLDKKSLDNAYANGFYSADGCEYKVKNRKHINKIIYLYGDKKKLLGRFNNLNYNIIENKDRIRLDYCKGLKNKFFIPFGYKLKDIIEWLSGYADGDGTILNNGGNISLQIGSVNLNFLKNIKLLLQEIGIHSKINKVYDESYKLMPLNNGTGEYGYFKCKENYRILITHNNLKKLVDMGFRTYRLKFDLSHIPNRNAINFEKILNVEELDGLYDTYCFTEPLRNMGMFNGMLLGNCQEVGQLSKKNEFSLSPYETENKFGYDVSCVLSSLNLVELFNYKSDYERKNIIISSIKFLSNVSDLVNIESVPSVRIGNNTFHSVGLKIS